MADTTARIRLALEGQGQVVQGMKQVEDGTASLRRSMASLVGGLSLGATVGQLVQVQREFDVLNSSLITVTGSSAAAEREMRWIKEFAATTPYGLNEVTGAFVKMKALGLDPSQKALTSYGNTASAMGKSLNQMIEAVADASTGEFERLKEFGIKAKKQGDDVSLTFRGVTTNIGNNSEEITRYLQKIGNNDFAGAMTTRAATLDGAISNLADSWDELFRTVNEAGVGDLMTESASTAAKALGGLSDAIRENKAEISALVGALSGAALLAALPKMAAGLTLVAGAVGALGVALAANPLVLTLLGIGAAVGAVAGYSNAVGKTADGMRRTITELERLNKMAAEQPYDAVLNANVGKRSAQIADLRARLNAAGQDARNDFALSDPRRVADYGNNFQSASTPAQEDPETAAKRLAEETRAAEKALTEERRRSAEVVELRNRLAGESYAAEQKNIQAARESNRELVQRYENSAANAAQRLTDLQNEADAVAYAEKYQIGMAQAVELTTIARLKEQQIAAMGNEAIVLQLQAEIDAREKIVGMLDSKAAREAGANLRKNQTEEWAKTWEQVGQSFTDALMQGGKSVKQYLEGLFRTMVLRPLLAPITGAIGSVFGGPAAAGQAGGGGLGTLSSLQSAYNGISTGFSGIGASVGSIGASFQYGTAAFSQQSTTLAAQEAGMGTLTGNLASAGSMLGGALVGFMAGKMISGGYSAIGKSGNAATVAGTALGAILGGPIGAAIGGALGGVFNRAFGRKAPVSTGSGIVGSFSTTGASVQGYNDQFAKGGWFRSNKSWTEYSAVSSDLDKFLDASLVAITGATRDYATLLGLNADAVNGATQSIRVSLKDLNAEQQQTAILGALSGFGDVLAGRVLAGNGASFIRDGETAATALTRLASSLTTVNVVFDTLNATLLRGSLIGADAASKLLDAFGGAEAFAAQTSAYYEAFYTQAERTNTATRQLTEVLAGLGLALPESRTAFRELVEAQDLYTDAGRSTYAALIGLAPVFDQITQATEQMGKALSDEVLRLRGLLTGSSVNSMGALQADFAIATAAARAGDAGALERLPAISQALESAAALQAVTAADLALVRGQLTASLSQTMQALGLDVPQFAVGTNYVPRDMLARIHEGEAIVPKAYNPAAGGNDAMVAELRAVRAELEGLRAEVRADVGHNAKTARILERVTPDGTSLSTVVAA